MTIRTRFAPSPTGYLHIGGVRTALFNFLLARRHGGQFVLRIDDTDAVRNLDSALGPILDGFRFLGVTWDEGPEVGGPYGPYFQSQRGEYYTDAAMRMLASGHAYPDYLSKDELEADRFAQGLRDFKTRNPDASADELAKEEGEIKKGNRRYLHRGPLRDADPADNVRRYREKPTTLRLKVPAGKLIVVEDLICGHCEQQADLISDPVLLRADGKALYNFASVVDDVEMKMTHVVRAREHLANTYTQVCIFEALNYPQPQFGHVPVVNEPKSKKKLSKRDMAKFLTPDMREKFLALGWSAGDFDKRDDLNPATVAFYKELGYLPAGIVNYLARLGWSLDDKAEIIKLPEMVANFSLERVNDAPASFDPAKLYWVAGEYMKDLPADKKIDGCVPFLQRAKLLGDVPTEAERALVGRIVAAAGDRIKLFSDVLTYGRPYLVETLAYDAKAVEKRLKKAGAADILRKTRAVIAATNPFDAATLDKELQLFCEREAIKAAEMVHPVRVATTGTEVGVGLFDALELLGKERVLSRIDAALAMA